MRLMRQVVWHAGLLGVASLLALRAVVGGDVEAADTGSVDLWSGRVDDLTRVEFEGEKGLRVKLEPRKDSGGTYLVGEVLTQPPEAAVVAGDAGVAAAPPPKERRPPERFVSVRKGMELVESLAQLKAGRALGKLGTERLEEFGLEGEGDGLVKVSFGAKVLELRVGDKTPGGRDRYVLDPSSGEAFVVRGSLVSDLVRAESRLPERQFHDFGEVEVAGIRLHAGERTRSGVRLEGGSKFWASEDSPGTKDETLSNWMSKVDRLRVTSFLEDFQPATGDEVVRVEYLAAGGKVLGFLELCRRPADESKKGNPGGRFRYAARSERSRWYGTVARSTGEQIDKDLATVLSH